MRGTDYFKDRLPLLMLQSFAMFLLALFLLAVGNEGSTIGIILVCWLLLLTGWLFVDFRLRKKKLDQLLALAEGLEEKYLIAEVAGKPHRADDRVYYRLLSMAGKSMLEQVSAVKRERREYREYIEQWIHEIKTPLTALKLLCDNNKSEITRTMLLELERLNHFAGQALYYVRSETVEKDYLIKETLLSDIVHQAVSDNKQLLLSNGVQIHLEDCEHTVFTDEKWVTFILNQLIGNAVRYRRENPVLIFRAFCTDDGISLSIEDNGIGIPADELPRIFEKGFTGTNGRLGKSSTGLGLYLCRRLCGKLGIGISAASGVGGTAITLSFICNHFCRMPEENGT